jgi:oligopeptide/dipeptide ABC transporter ATP-binding protein
VLCDEPTSALDVSVQAAILNLLADLQSTAGVSYVFISHDLGVVRYLSDRIAVLYLGRIMEIGPAEDVFNGPHHPYTEALLDCYADPRAETIELGSIPGSPPDLSLDLEGCSFAPRCPLVEDVCRQVEPDLTPLGSGRAACHVRARAAAAGLEVGHVR